MGNFIVRQITESDYSNVYNMIKTAFETAEHRDGDEQDYAANLRKGENYIPQLELVASVEGKLIGHIMFTKTYVTKPNGDRYYALLVAPLSTLLEYRSMGVGSRLMIEGFRIAKEMGYESAFLIGDPNYYNRFGYKLTHIYGIKHLTLPQEYLMAKEIIPNSLIDVSGIISI